MTSTSTIAAGGYDADANDVPGMFVGSDPTSGVRHTGFLDAGSCSKVVRALPNMAKYFKNLRSIIVGMQGQSKSTNNALGNLLRGQSDINNETNLLNYWMRQMSPHMTKMNSELRTGNDALAGMHTRDPTTSNAPNPPDALTLLPAPVIGELMLYFVRPSYSGTTVVTGYELVTFPTTQDAMKWTNASETFALNETSLAAATNTAPWNTPHCDDMFSLYGKDLRIVTATDVAGLTSDICIRIRAKNTSGLKKADLWSQWSAPTLVCKAAESQEELQPFLEDIIPGCELSLVSWRAPMVQQSDESFAFVGGIHSYMINGTIVTGGSSTAAQVPLGPRGESVTVTVTACTDAVGTIEIGESDEMTADIPTAMPYPVVSVVLTKDDNGAFALVNVSIQDDYYTDTGVKYTITANNITSGGAVITSVIHGSDPNELDPAHTMIARVPSTGYLVTDAIYSFYATAEHVSIVTDGPTYKSDTSPTTGTGGGGGTSGGGDAGGGSDTGGGDTGGGTVTTPPALASNGSGNLITLTSNDTNYDVALFDFTGQSVAMDADGMTLISTNNGRANIFTRSTVLDDFGEIPTQILDTGGILGYGGGSLLATVYKRITTEGERIHTCRLYRRSQTTWGYHSEYVVPVSQLNINATVQYAGTTADGNKAIIRVASELFYINLAVTTPSCQILNMPITAYGSFDLTYAAIANECITLVGPTLSVGLARDIVLFVSQFTTAGNLGPWKIIGTWYDGNNPPEDWNLLGMAMSVDGTTIVISSELKTRIFTSLTVQWSTHMEPAIQWQKGNIISISNCPSPSRPTQTLILGNTSSLDFKTFTRNMATIDSDKTFLHLYDTNTSSLIMNGTNVERMAIAANNDSVLGFGVFEETGLKFHVVSLSLLRGTPSSIRMVDGKQYVAVTAVTNAIDIRPDVSTAYNSSDSKVLFTIDPKLAGQYLVRFTWSKPSGDFPEWIRFARPGSAFPPLPLMNVPLIDGIPQAGFEYVIFANVQPGDCFAIEVPPEFTSSVTFGPNSFLTMARISY